MRGVAAVLILGFLGPPEGPPEGPSEFGTEPESVEVGELSEQGTRRGALEFGLGALLSGGATGLIAFGTVQFIRAREHVEFCRTSVAVIGDGGGSDSGGIDPCVFDPPPLGFASAGLSWGFSIALLTGAGLLFARGARVRADARRFDALDMQVSLLPWWRRDGGGGALLLRF